MIMVTSIVPIEVISHKIYLIRGHKVILDRDLAMLYGVETKVLVQTVKRNKDRFPADFMFQLARVEFLNLKSQIVTSSLDHGGLRKLPHAFTEQGVAMLSSVLRSKRAVLVNVQIIRAFVQMRDMLRGNEQLRLRIEAMEKQYDEQFKIVFTAIKRLIKEDEVPKPQIGFRTKEQKEK